MYDEKYLKKFAGNMIKEMREQKNITQDELAEALNITRQAISRYENGDRGINQNLLFKMADYFNVTINDFFPPTKKNEQDIETKIEYTEYMQKISNNLVENLFNSLSKEQQNKVIEYMEFLKSKEQ